MILTFFITPGVNDHQYATERVHSKRDEAFFIIINIISNGDSNMVVQDCHRIGKVNPMLSKIGGGFGPIPFEIHKSTICTTVHTVKLEGMCGWAPLR